MKAFKVICLVAVYVLCASPQIASADGVTTVAMMNAGSMSAMAAHPADNSVAPDSSASTVVPEHNNPTPPIIVRSSPGAPAEDANRRPSVSMGALLFCVALGMSVSFLLVTRYSRLTRSHHHKKRTRTLDISVDG